jgi:hypothetical protein
MTTTMQRPEIQTEDPAPTPKRRRTGRVLLAAGVFVLAGATIAVVAANDSSSTDPAPTVDASQDPLVTRFGENDAVDVSQDPLVTRFGASQTNQDPLVTRFGN